MPRSTHATPVFLALLVVASAVALPVQGQFTVPPSPDDDLWPGTQPGAGRLVMVELANEQITPVSPPDTRYYVVGYAGNITPIEPGDTFHGARVLVENEAVGFLRVRADDPENFQLQVSADENVTYVRRYDPTRLEPTFTANDPMFPQQWGLHAFPGMAAKDAWDTTRGSLKVTVAVLDTGLEKGHEDIGHYTQGYDFFNLDGEPEDVCGHGTHVAGTVGALTDNNVGVAGSARVSIMPVKVMGQPPEGGGCTGSSSALANGITYAADHGANVIVMSLGCPKGCWSQAVADAIEYAYSKGVLLVSSAGNTGPCSDCVGFPANHPKVLAVSASNPDGSLAGYSSTGSEVELIAPGSRILSTYIGNRYATMSGTSMAAPHVAGAAGLVASVNTMSNTKLRSHLAATATKTGLPPTAEGSGAVHSERAVESAVTPPNVPPVAKFTASCKYLSCTLDASASYDPDGSIVRYRWSFGDGATATGLKGTHTYAQPGTYTVTLTVVDDKGATATLKKQVVATKPNQPPTAAILANCKDLRCDVSGAASVDEDGNITSYRWSFGDGATATGISVSHTYPEPGTYTVTLTVTDDAGYTDTAHQNVTVTRTNTQATVLLEETFEEDVTGWRKSSGPNDLWRVLKGCIQDPDGTRTLAFARPAPDCDYDVGHAQGWVRTPPLDAAGYDALTLAFEHIWETESTAEKPFDVMEVQVSTDGGSTWTTVRQWDSTNTNLTQWETVSVDLAPFATDGLLVRWFFDSKDASFNDQAGWYVDDVRVAAASDHVPNQDPRANFTWECTGLGCTFDGLDPQAPSADPDGNITTFSWSFGGGGEAKGPAVAHTFPAPGTYTVTLTVTDDRGATGSVSHDVTVKAPETQEQTLLAEGFDDGSVTGWRKSTQATDLWRITSSCAPQDRPSRYAAFTRAAPRCDYDVGRATGWLRAPPLQLSGALHATLNFEHIWETETTANEPSDVMAVQVSTDGGASWDTVKRWTSLDPNPNEWRKVSLDLTGYASDMTLVRWAFDSRDGSFNDHAGWFVDDVEVVVETRPQDAPMDGANEGRVEIVEPGEDVTLDEPGGRVEGEPGPLDVPGPAVPVLALAVVLAAALLRAVRRARRR